MMEQPMSRTAWVVVALSLVFALSSWVLPHPWTAAQGEDSPTLVNCDQSNRVCRELRACTTVRCVAEIVWAHESYLQLLDARLTGVQTRSGSATGGKLACTSDDLRYVIDNEILALVPVDNKFHPVGGTAYFTLDCSPTP
jgi:hypothetical protein